ncbi:prolipoprotein diacylglyceryl transferase [Haematospirillum sp. H1815]|uniref:prolipoprotein diacylglyceryl transferase n=1 Tax=Haematospirillum sp. H1815 TaxID=2723108 RepID=UPI00143963DA|nr:prolipoprotein diacylglyceryl transferase [Haematospirillum sp. H1815]NKD77393.1 prolipoprotein diacylglyceryl transferase [Haematospirillum sp. H1815]
MSEPLMFPAFDPVALQIGPLAIRWYALAYMTGLLGGWQLMKYLAGRIAGSGMILLSDPEIDDYLVWVTLGVVLGGRLGYVLFYKPDYYLDNPLEVAALWHGGMSFHGGFLGVLVATILFCRFRGIPLLFLLDLAAMVAPLGLMLGRLANFINGELWGRVADPSVVPWAMVFPGAGPDPRHPSQLYEAGLEGLALLVVMLVLFFRFPAVRLRFGVLTGVGMAGYGCARFFVEFFREPDAFLGVFWGGVSMGQILSLPMVVFGIWLMSWAWKRPA